MKKPGLILSIVLGLFVLWHLVVCLTVPKEYCADPIPTQSCNLRVTIEVNPLTDVATLESPGAAVFGITDPTEAAGFNWGRNLTGVPTAESHLNLYARQYFDLYAMLLPYRVSIVDRREEKVSDSTLPSTSAPAHWPNVIVLGFRAGESARETGQHAVDLGITKVGAVNTCKYREDGSGIYREYVDCEFLGNDGGTLQTSFYLGQLQRIEWHFRPAYYDAVLRKIEDSFGPPRTLTDPHDPSYVVSQRWGGQGQRFDVSLGQTADARGAWVSVVFSPR